jgi:AraC-like DNA-binding protein
MAEFCGNHIEFEAQADEVAFAKAIEEIPVTSSDPYLNKLLISHFEQALSQRQITESSFRSIVENAIVPLLPHGQARADEVASKLGIGRRTFARRLCSEGTTFSEILERLRSDLGRHYLDDKSLSISQVAWLLGYQEVSAFTHAFKRWTGKTPRQVRLLKSATM